jgi:hypothetical protein
MQSTVGVGFWYSGMGTVLRRASRACNCYTLAPVARASLLLLVVVLAGCREHTLDDGTYAFTETGALRDDCGLAGQGVLGTGTLATAGHQVTLALTRPPGTLTGTYRYNLEQMVLDGSVANYEATVRGQACLETTVTVHTETQTVDPTHFNGTLALTYDSRLPETCSCQYWFTYQAARTGP